MPKKHRQRLGRIAYSNPGNATHFPGVLGTAHHNRAEPLASNSEGRNESLRQLEDDAQWIDLAAVEA